MQDGCPSRPGCLGCAAGQNGQDGKDGQDGLPGGNNAVLLPGQGDLALRYPLLLYVIYSRWR